MGLLLYQPGTPNADGGDHYVVVLAADQDTVELHDPHGHPYAMLPAQAFLSAWEARAVSYTDAPFVLRAGFARHVRITPAVALRQSLPQAERWLAYRELPMPPGSLGGTAAVEALADLVARGTPPGIRTLLTAFGVRVGARRLNDAATCLQELGLSHAASIAQRQARILGGLQYPLVRGDDATAAAQLRHLAPSTRNCTRRWPRHWTASPDRREKYTPCLRTGTSSGSPAPAPSVPGPVPPRAVWPARPPTTVTRRPACAPSTSATPSAPPATAPTMTSPPETVRVRPRRDSAA